ncbi:hypothetical protein EJB05_49917, partial [Eragrostis curvula]
MFQKQWLWDNPLKFSHLRHLPLFFSSYPKDVERVLYLVSVLKATPFIEKLETHLHVVAVVLGVRPAEEGTSRRPGSRRKEGGGRDPLALADEEAADELGEG